MPPRDHVWEQLVHQAAARVAAVEALNADTGQRGRSWSLPVDSYARIPVWSGRVRWQQQLRVQLDSPAGAELLRSHHIGRAAVLAVAGAHAVFAETATGRDVTASREVIATRAGVSVTVVKRARRVLAALSMAVEMVRGRFLRTDEVYAAQAHHGGHQVRAASVWALSSPRGAVLAAERRFPTAPARKVPRARRRRTGRDIRATSTAAPTPGTRTTTRSSAPAADSSRVVVRPRVGARGPLSLAGSFDVSSLVRENSPTHLRAGEMTTHTRPEHTPTPRTLATQRAAAELIVRVPVLASISHPGRVCDVLDAVGIDTARWLGRDIARRLDQDTRDRGWIWPDRIDAPLALLRWRLTRIDFTGPSPTELAAHTHQLRRRAAAEHQQAQTAARAAAASPEVRADVLARTRRMLTDRRTHRTHSPARRPSITDPKDH